MEKVIVVKDIVKRIRRFNLTGRTLEFKIKSVPEGEEPVGWIKDAVQQVIQKGIEDLEPSDQVAFSFCSKDLKRGEGWLKFRPAAEVTLEDVWSVISSVYQSNSIGLNTDTFCLGVTTVRLPAGKGRNSSKGYNTFEEECSNRRGIVVIANKDRICLPRSLVVAKAFVDKDPQYSKVRKDTGKLQLQRARNLLEEAELEIPEEGAGINELQRFQDLLSAYNIVVYKYGNKGRDVIYKGGDSEKRLNLLYHEGHYNVITSLTAAFGCSYYCQICNVPYDHKQAHRCGGTCPCCYQSPVCSLAMKVHCDECKRSFRGQSCYDNHLKPGSYEKSTVCKTIVRCEKCLKTLKNNRAHTCGEIFCKICQKHQPDGHLCYIQVDTGKPKSDFLFVFFDFETRQEKVLHDGSLLHEPNLCVYNQVCHLCINTDIKICTKCGVRQQILRNEHCVSRFMEYLLGMGKLFKNVVVLSHNGGSFDNQFILNYILTKTDITPELIMRGTKIILMQMGRVKFLDSLNYFPMALSKLPKAFGLGDNFKKGYFPHLFNTIDNQNYIGPLPDIKYYDPDILSEKDRAAFLKWYFGCSNNNYIFNFQNEIVEYCKSDVEILTAACLKFRQQMLETSNVDPFTEATTIASTCSRVFRRNFLKPNVIGVIPKNGYRNCNKQSKIAIHWLVWLEKQLGINIMHAAKGKEVVLGGLKVDGYCQETNQVFEFHGCYYHGCPRCIKHNRDRPLHEDPSSTLNYRYESTKAKTERLKSLGHEVVETWECEFRKNLTPEMREYVKNHPLVSCAPLDPRDAFYGGRTGNTLEYYKCSPGERIKYVDVCSLYPYICKSGKFPIGHPRVLTGDECKNLDLNKIDGLIKCKVLPPTDLYHPVLPTKMNNKLMFVLCHTCGENMYQKTCTHNENERAITGTWVIDEVIKAIEKGYQLREVYEIWRYQVERYDKESNLGGLFREMMDRFLKVKQQASGWPSGCSTPEQKEQYIENFLKAEGIRLEFSEITENPGLRSLAKLILNSFWGKLGQKENQPKTSIINKPEEFFEVMTNPEIAVNSVLPINESTIIVNWEYIEEAYDVLPTVNVCIAAYVTAQARLKLYSHLEKLGERVLYYDTDSILYTLKEGEYDVPIGDFIGDMTDELAVYGSNSYITEFVSGGPKNYAYKVFSTRDNEEMVVCKVKGITLNYSASKLVNFETIKDMVLNKSALIPITAKQFRRTKEYEVITTEETKVYRTNSTKRKFFEDHTSVPFGFKKRKY